MPVETTSVDDGVVEVERRDRHDAEARPSSMRNGYSLVPCGEPRNFTTRSRRMASWSSTRWSREITQSRDVLLEAVAGEACRRPARR